MTIWNTILRRNFENTLEMIFQEKIEVKRN